MFILDDMNLLSHYYIDQHVDSPDYKLGLIFPDLQRGFNALLRKDLLHTTTLNETEQAFVDGIKKHYLVDKCFHNLPYFDHYTALLKQLIQQHTNIDHRVYFLAHIYLEMLIDKALIVENTLLTVSFYEDMRNVNRKALIEHLSRMGKADLATAFFGNFNKFLEARYLDRYSNNESFVHGVLYSFERATGVSTSATDRDGMLTITDLMMSEHSTDLLKVFQTLDEQI